MRFVVEGVRFLEEADATGAPVEVVLATARAAETARGGALLERFRARRIDVREASDTVLDAVCGTRAAQGICALVTRQSVPIEALFDGVASPFVVVASGLSDPGNLGTLLRTADAAGATGFVTTRETVSPWNDKALRATAGSVFRLPLAAGVAFSELVARGRAAGARIAAAGGGAGITWHEADLRPPLVLVLGSEGFGLADEVRDAADLRVRIPLAAGVESLNVAAAGAILCFEVARQATRARESGA